MLDNQFYLKQSKCSFGQHKIDYLGHIVSSKGVEPDPAKVQAVKDWPQPSTVKELRAFLGLSGYYRKFIKNYASIAGPLTDMLQKDQFSWSTEATKSFEQLKSTLCEAPILKLPDFSVL